MSEEGDSVVPDGVADGALALELYAAAVVATRRCYAALAQANPPMAELEHVAACVARSASNPALAITVALAAAARDDAALAVQSACLAVRVARRASTREQDLTGMALAALLVDSGRVRLATASAIDLDVFSELPDSLNHLAPAATAALAVGGERSPLREAAALTAFEVAWLERPRLGALYQGEHEPRLSSRVLLACRALLMRTAPRTHDAELSPFDALRELASKPGADTVAVRLLADAIGYVPVGTVVELASGAWGVAGPQPAAEPGRPVLFGLVDARGAIPGRPSELGEREIVRVITPKRAHFNPAFPLVAARSPAAK